MGYLTRARRLAAPGVTSLIAALLVLGCGPSTVGVESETTAESRSGEPGAANNAPNEFLSGTCPSAELSFDASICSQLPEGYGRTPETPLEWGAGALGSSLFFGRLVCPDGAIPSMKRGGNIGRAPVPSESPSSGSPMGTADIIDRWSVSCPGERAQTWYINPYRCGNPCPPSPLGILSAEATNHLAEFTNLSGELREADNKDEILVAMLNEAEQGVAAAPTSAALNTKLAIVLFMMKRYEKSVEAWEVVVERNPENPYNVLHHGMAARGAGKPEVYIAAVEQLLDALSEKHDLWPELNCRKAFSLKEAERKDEALEWGRKACDMGRSGCCTLVQELTPE